MCNDELRDLTLAHARVSEKKKKRTRISCLRRRLNARQMSQKCRSCAILFEEID